MSCICALGPTTHASFMFHVAEVLLYLEFVLTTALARYFAPAVYFIVGCIPNHLPVCKMASRLCYPHSDVLGTCGIRWRRPGCGLRYQRKFGLG